MDELHENRAMAGLEKQRLIFRRFITNLVWNNMSCNDISRNHSNTHIARVYSFIEYTRIHIYIYTLNSRVPRIVGTGVVSFKSVGCRCWCLFNRQNNAQDCRPSLPPPSRSALLRPRSSAAGSLLFSKCSFVTSRWLTRKCVCVCVCVDLLPPSFDGYLMKS